MTETEHDDIEWQAWEVDDLPESFADDVLDAIDRGGPLDEAERLVPAASGPPPARRGWAIAVVGGALAAAAAVALWVATRPDPLGDEAAQVAAFDGVGVTDEDELATWRWVSTSERAAVAEQTAGRVRWDADRGVPLTVQTPAGRVVTSRAAFSLEVLQMSKSKLPLIAGTAVAGTVAAVVYMHSGSAELSNAKGSADVAAPGSAVMSDESAPHSLSESTVAPKVAVQSVLQTPKPKIDWQAAKVGIEAALHRRHPEPIPPAADDAPVARDYEGESLGSLPKEYIRDTVQEQVVPLVKECYQDLLEREPDLSGRMVLQFAIMGDESVGGIVDEMEFGADSEIQDLDFRECVSETMMSTVFDPPQGGGKVMVTYPFIFAADYEEALEHTPGNDAPVSGDPATYSPAKAPGEAPGEAPADRADAPADE